MTKPELIVSSFCEFELEKIESFLKKSGIDYRIETFELEGIKCFNLYVSQDIDFVREMTSIIEYSLLQEYSKNGISGLWNIQKLIQEQDSRIAK